MNHSRYLALLLSLIVLQVRAQSFPVDTIQNKGSITHRINLVILGDGYIEEELPQFAVDARNFTRQFFNNSPYTEYQNYFNVFAIQVPSNESGASHPGTATDVTEPVHPVADVDNFFGSTFDGYNIHRLLIIQNHAAVTTVMANTFPSYDLVVMLVNTPYYGGSGGQYAVASVNSASADVANHEIGHSFARLKDEYWAGDLYAGEGINMTQENRPDDVRWKNWYGENTIGIYPHCCGGNAENWYKPNENCKMQRLGSPFCSVCIEGIVQQIQRLTEPVSSYSPSRLTQNEPLFPLDFILETIKPEPNTLKRTWFLNTHPIALNQDSIQLTASDLINGTNTLTVVVEDTTELMRIDDTEELFIQSITWSIETTWSDITIRDNGARQFEITLYPNPTTGILHISMKGGHHNHFSVAIYDMHGILRKAVTEVITSTTLLLAEWPSGNYVVHLLVDNQVVGYRTIIKQ